MENVIEIKKLYKSFGEVKAVDDISFRVKKGELFAFLGLNGAGKSTSISIMCGQLSKDSGKVYVCGYDIDKDIDKVKSEIGVVFQNSVLDKSLSVRDNLKFRAALYGIVGKEFLSRLEELDSLLYLHKLFKRSYGKLSGGEKRRVDIARALLHKPQILILDEPTTGLDPQSRKIVWNVVNSLRENDGVTVFLTTHYMEEAADADYVVILDSGKIVAEGTPLDLKNKYTGDFITIYNADTAAIDALKIGYSTLPDAIRIEVASTEDATRMIIKNSSLFKDYEITKGKMNDVFLAATGKALVEDEQ